MAVDTPTTARSASASSIAMDQFQPTASAIPGHGTEAPERASIAAPKHRSKTQVATIIFALNLALLVAALNATIVATAIPTISNEFGSATGYVWIGGAYLLANSATAPLWAKCSDIWGRKPLLLAALAIFFVASIICAQAVSMGMLIAGRALQGIAGGGLFSLVMIITSDIFSMRQRTLFFGILGFTWATAGAAGPILGGLFTQLVTWRWCFYMSLPTAGVAAVLIVFALDVHNPKTNMAAGLRAVDWLGSVSLVGMVLMVLLGLDFGGVIFPWNSPKVICLIVFGALFSVFFYTSEKRWAKYPVMPLEIFRDKSNAACFLIAFLQGFVFIAGEYYLPLYFQSVKSASPLKSGVLTIPTTIAEAASSIAVGFEIHRTGRYQGYMWLGTAFMTLGYGLFISFGVDASIAVIVIFQVIAGIGAGALFDPPLIALQANIPQDQVATASATMGTLRNIAQAISVVVGGVVFQNCMGLQKTDLYRAGLDPELIEAIAGPMATANIEKVALIQDPSQQQAAKGALAWSLRNMWILYTCIAFLALVASAFVRKHDLSQEHVETRTGIDEKNERQQRQPLTQNAEP